MEMLYSTKYKDFTRYVWEDEVIWRKGDENNESDYCVAQFPFVTGYFVCSFVEYDEDDWGYATTVPLTRFDKLTDALGMLRVMENSHV